MRQDHYYLDLICDYFRKGKKVGFIDDVGRGSLAGDLYTCCIVMEDNSFYDCTINDSKKIDKKNMEALSDLIKHNVLEYSLGITSLETINAIRNINQATSLAMVQSVDVLKNKPDVLFIDGIVTIPVPIHQHVVAQGDSKIFGIACASIIAKHERDTYMKQLHSELPYYGWNTNAGYGSEKHFAGIRLHGLSKYHRLYYRGINEHINNESIS